MLFYVALLSLSLLLVAETLIFVTRSYGSLRAAQRIEQDGGFALERIAREIRDATSVNEAESVLSVQPGVLTLDTSTASGTPRTVAFSVDDGSLMLSEDGVVSGALTGAKTSVGTLIFRKITTGHSEGVKVEMALQSGSGVSARSENFYVTAVLRDSY